MKSYALKCVHQSGTRSRGIVERYVDMKRSTFLFTTVFLLLLNFKISFADQPAICETDSFVHVEDLIEIFPYSCGYAGCGVFISAPSNYEGVPFEDFIVTRGSLENSDLRFQLKSHDSGQMVGAFIFGEQTQVEQFTVTAVYKSLDDCIIHSSAKTQHNKAN